MTTSPNYKREKNRFILFQEFVVFAIFSISELYFDVEWIQHFECKIQGLLRDLIESNQISSLNWKSADGTLFDFH